MCVCDVCVCAERHPQRQHPYQTKPKSANKCAISRRYSEGYVCECLCALFATLLLFLVCDVSWDAVTKATMRYSPRTFENVFSVLGSICAFRIYIYICLGNVCGLRVNVELWMLSIAVAAAGRQRKFIDAELYYMGECAWQKGKALRKRYMYSIRWKHSFNTFFRIHLRFRQF